jgi:hypothetical protein
VALVGSASEDLPGGLKRVSYRTASSSFNLTLSIDARPFSGLPT